MSPSLSHNSLKVVSYIFHGPIGAEIRERIYISLGMSKKMSKRISLFELTNERWVRKKFSTNKELHNLTLILKMSFLDICELCTIFQGTKVIIMCMSILQQV